MTHGLIPEGAKVTVGVSGGVDSMVLLQVLAQMAARHGWSLIVAHANHQLRGEASDQDEERVREATRVLGLSFVSTRLDVAGTMRERKISLEMAARELRHAWLARVSHEAGADRIALAHHADDQVELALLRLLRGTSGHGLAGMRAQSPSPAASDLLLVRPLLHESKAAIRAYSDVAGLNYREDASNEETEFARNRVRQEVLPAIQRCFGRGFERNVLRAMSIVGDEADCIREQAEAWRRNPAQTPFSRLHVAVQRRVVTDQLIDLGGPPTFKVVEYLRQNPGRCVHAPGGMAIMCDVGGRLHRNEAPKPDWRKETLEIDLVHDAGLVILDGVSLEWSRFSVSQGSDPPAAGEERFDGDRVGGLVVLRHWVPGDRFHPIGMPYAVKIQDFFVNAKVPRAERHRKWVAATKQGEIFWIEGMRIAEPFKLTDTTQRVLRWRWQREENA